MTTATARLLDEVLELPEEERAGLVVELLGTLSPVTPAEARSEDAWLAEIERRARAALAGSPGVPWDVARAEIERRRQTRR